MRGLPMRRTLALFALLTIGLSSILSAGALTGSIIRGSTQNLTRGQPAVGDDVILIRLDRMLDSRMPMEAEAHTKTDTHGAFLLPVRYPSRAYLVRVLHQGVTYDRQASGGNNLSIAVFDAAARVPGITGSIEILRVGTRFASNQKRLHVSDMYEIRNESNPPMTLAGSSTFDVYLPANASIDSVLAAGPGLSQADGRDGVHEKMGVMIAAASVAGEPGHYTVNFPLRPGATRFAFNYDVPYQVHAVFQTRHDYAFQQFAVMIPRTMRFSSAASAFQRLATGTDEYEVQATMQLKAGEGPEFEVSGDGPLPSLQAGKQAQPPSTVSPDSTASDSRRVLPASEPGSVSKFEKAPSLRLWFVLAGLILLACVLLILRAGNRWLGGWRATSARLGGRTKASLSFVESLKEELFQLEVDWTRGAISEEEYSSARLALEEIVKRAVARAPKSC